MSLHLIPTKSPYYNFITNRLSANYSNKHSEYEQMLLEQLINSRPSHLYALYKDFLTWNDTKEHCQCYYKRIKSTRKLPIITAYHKNYVRFFCRPFIWNSFFDHLLQTYTQKIAKVFYKTSYGKMEETGEDEDQEGDAGGGGGGGGRRCIKENKGNDGIIVGNEEDDDKNNEDDGFYNKTIFDSSVRKNIDADYISEICNTNNDEDMLSTAKDLLTVEGNDDFLVDLLSNFSSNRNRRNAKMKLMGHSTNMVFFSPSTIGHKDPNKTKQDNNAYNNNLINHTKKTKLKMSYCTLYKQASIGSSDLRSNNNSNVNPNNTLLNNNNMNTQSLMITNKGEKETKVFKLHSPKFPINSKFSEFKKFSSQVQNKSNNKSQSQSQSKSKSKQNSYASKTTINDNHHHHHNHKLHYTTASNYNNKNKSSYFKYSIDNKSMISFKSPTSKLTKQSLLDDQLKKPSKTKKSNYSSSPHSNLLITYLNSCCNSRQMKTKGDSCFSLRNISNDNKNNKSYPLQKNHLIKPPHTISLHPKSSHSFSNNMLRITHDHRKQKHTQKHKHKHKHKPLNSFSKDNKKNNKTNDCIDGLKTHFKQQNPSPFSLSKETSINHTQGNNLNGLILSNNTMPHNKGLSMPRNQSQSNVFGERLKSVNTSDVEKFINGIKKHFNSNRFTNSDISNSNSNSNCYNNKHTKSTKYNDSSQTSSNTHHHNHSKSPKLLDKMKNEYNFFLNSNSSLIKRYGNQSSKASRHSSPGNSLKMFFSQRK